MTAEYLRTSLEPLFTRLDDARKLYLLFWTLLREQGYRVKRIIPEVDSPLPRIIKDRPARALIPHETLVHLARDPEKVVLKLLEVKLPDGRKEGLGDKGASYLVRSLKEYRRQMGPKMVTASVTLIE